MTATTPEAPVTTQAAGNAKLALPLKALQRAMATIAPAIDRRSTIPILTSVRIEQGDDHLVFTGTNLDLSITVQVATQGATPSKAFLLPAAKLTEDSKLLDGDVVSVAVKDERATLRCGRSTTKMLSQPLGNFPRVATAPGESSIALSQAELTRMLRLVDFTISKEASRYALSGALLEVAGNALRLVGTDGHRLSCYKVPSEYEPLSVLLPAVMLAALGKVLDEDSDVPVLLEITDSDIFATISDASGSIEIGARRMSGQFPTYAAVIPSQTLVSVTVDAAHAAEAMRRSLSFADTNTSAVKLIIGKEDIQMHSASTECGETDEVIDVLRARVPDDFTPFPIGFCGDYLLDAFSRLTGDVELRFSATDGANALLMVASPADGEQLEHVIMPMRLQ